MNWISRSNQEIKPPIDRALLCYCPEWNDSGYQIATFNGREFEYDEMPNEMFDALVTDWTIFIEVD